MHYASVGFGGATGYLAVMSLFGIEPQVMASTSLVLNVIVASILFIIYTGGAFVLDVLDISLIPLGVIGALADRWLDAQRISNLNLRRVLGIVMSFAVSNFWLTFWK